MAEQQPEDLRAVILNRVSSIRQEDGFSLDAQDELNREYCKKKHLIIVQAFTFSESAGPKKIRTEFQSVLDFLRKHEIRHLVVEKTDRLLRNFYDYIKIEEMMQDITYVYNIISTHFGPVFPGYHLQQHNTR